MPIEMSTVCLHKHFMAGHLHVDFSAVIQGLVITAIVGVGLTQWLLKEYISELKDLIMLLAFIVVCRYITIINQILSNVILHKIHYIYLQHTLHS